MFYTSILQSLSHPLQRYIGTTSDLERRLQEHNAGNCRHTAKLPPWRITVYCAIEPLRTAQTIVRQSGTLSCMTWVAKRGLNATGLYGPPQSTSS